MKPTTSQLSTAIESLNWSGHVELPTTDIRWLAEQILSILFPARREQSICELCEKLKLNVVPTKLGQICWDCIETLSEYAEEDRMEIEG